MVINMNLRPLITLLSILVSSTFCFAQEPTFPTTTLFETIPSTDEKEGTGYRIPALTVTRGGTVLAFCERRVGLHDHGENDIVLRRSTDGGENWGALVVVAEAGGDSLNDPLVVVLESGRILLRYTHFPEGVHARNSRRTVIAEPGYGGPKHVRLFVTYSDDDGRTWSEPKDFTRAMRREGCISVASPGVGMQISNGPNKRRIVFPNYEVYHLGEGKRKFQNSVSYSDDGGNSWKLSAPVPVPDDKGMGDEAQIVEISGNRLLMSARNHLGGTARLLSISEDGGETWSRQRYATDLMTPACMSSLIRYRRPNGTQPGLLLHSLPNTKESRSNGALFFSQDEGKTWKKAGILDPGGFAYSCLTRLPNGNVACLYETEKYSTIEFMQFPLEKLGLINRND